MPEGKNGFFTRAANYFTIWELFGRRTEDVNIIWQRLRSLIDVDRPLPADTYKLLGIFDTGASRIRETQEKVKRHLSKLAADDIILARGELGYPRLLEETEGAPEFLFVRGNVQLLHEPTLAVVGTRNPSEQGARRAQKLGHLLAEHGIVVASGLAKGIDKAAHMGALSVGGNTIAVIGTPLTRVYPKEHEELQRQISEVGAVVSQFYPGAGVQKFYFPMRNAVMSGLSLGTIVVEASETSGALIQARQCLKQGRKLFIPQSAVDNENLSWPKKYLQRPNAHSFSQIEDLLTALEQEHLFSWQSKIVAEGAIDTQPLQPINLTL